MSLPAASTVGSVLAFTSTSVTVPSPSVPKSFTDTPMALIHDFTADSVVAPCCTPSFTGRPSAAAAASNEAFTSALLSDALS